MTEQVHNLNNSAGEKNTTYRKKKQRRQTFLFETRVWMFSIPLQVGTTTNGLEMRWQFVCSAEELYGVMSRTALLSCSSLHPYFSCHRPSFLLQFLFQMMFFWSSSKECFVHQHQTSHACWFVTHSNSWKPQNPTRLSRVHLGIMSVSLKSHEVCFIPAWFTEWSSVYPIWRGIFMIYKNAIKIWRSAHFGLASLYV